MDPFVLAAGLAATLALVAVVFVGIVSFNAIVGLGQRTSKAWGNVEVALQQRHDELPNLVGAVRDVMSFEEDVLEEVARLRAAYAPDRPIPEQAATATATSRAVRSLFAVVERYPELRSADNVRSLQREIERLETVIADRRELYNDMAYRYNSAIQQLPAALYAGLFGWRPREYFSAATDAASVPDVSLREGSAERR